MQDREFQIRGIVGLQSDVQEPFSHEAEHPFVVIRICGDVQPGFQLKEDVEQPAAVTVQQVAPHDEHVEPVSPGPCEGAVKGFNIVRAALGQNLPRDGQVFLVVCMDILAVAGFFGRRTGAFRSSASASRAVRMRDAFRSKALSPVFRSPNGFSPEEPLPDRYRR